MSQENVEVTRGGFDAFNRGDLDWISERHHPAIEWTTTSEDPDAGTHRGRDSVRRYFEQWMESFSELRGEIEECFEVSDGRVFAAAHFIGRGRTSGVEMDWRLFLVYTYMDGTVLRAEEYFDRNEALEALGLSEQAMSQENVELARRGYSVLNAAYESGDVSRLLPLAEETWDPDIVLTTTGRLFPESGEWRGHQGLLRFTAAQMEAFTQMWIEPQEYIDAGDRLVVPVRLGGQARHTGIEMEFSVVHVFSFRNGKATRLDVFLNKTEALEAAGLSEQAMSQENVEVVRRMYEAWMAGDDEAIQSIFDPAIRLNPDPEASWVGIDDDYVGLDGFRRYMGAVYEAFEDYRPEVERIIDAGEGRVLTLAVEHGRGRGSGAEVQAAKTAHLWTLRDGKAVRLDLFLERSRALETVGLSEQDAPADS